MFPAEPACRNMLGGGDGACFQGRKIGPAIVTYLKNTRISKEHSDGGNSQWFAAALSPEPGF
jgi:hypothetical protein